MEETMISIKEYSKYQTQVQTGQKKLKKVVLNVARRIKYMII